MRSKRIAAAFIMAAMMTSVFTGALNADAAEADNGSTAAVVEASGDALFYGNFEYKVNDDGSTVTLTNFVGGGNV